jgi:hypothetical protein
MTASINQRHTTYDLKSAVQEIALAGFWISQYSVQDSSMLPVVKLGFGAGIYGGICAADGMEV